MFGFPLLFPRIILRMYVVTRLHLLFLHAWPKKAIFLLIIWARSLRLVEVHPVLVTVLYKIIPLPLFAAVVSIRPEYGPAAQAAAATGQPLMAAQTAVPTAPQAPYTLPYMPPHMMAPPGQQVYQQVCMRLATPVFILVIPKKYGAFLKNKGHS